MSMVLYYRNRYIVVSSEENACYEAARLRPSLYIKSLKHACAVRTPIQVYPVTFASRYKNRLFALFWLQC